MAFSTVVWIVSGLLAAMYFMSGLTKILRPAKMQATNRTLGAVSEPGLRAIGAAEVLGAIGVIVPPAVDVLSWVAVLAAGGLAMIQLLAIPRHVRNHERQPLPFNSLLLAMALFVLLARSGAIP